MIAIRGLSPNSAYLQLLRLAAQNEFPLVDSRLGRHLDLGHVFVELDQGERLCLLKDRGFNPVFALVETAWLLVGSNELAPLKSIISTYDVYSDDGLTLYGAYGHRLRKKFGEDQIEAAVRQLSGFPTSRRVVLSLYSPDDLEAQSRDIPCNTQVMLRIEEERLAMTVINRSNDLWLGVPYNWFAFRGLQELIAKRLTISPGPQRHISACLHLYEKDIAAARKVVASNSISSIQRLEENIIPLNMEDFFADLDALSAADFSAIRSPELAACIRRFVAFRESRQLESASSKLALDVALKNWIAMRKNSQGDTAVSEFDSHNPDSPTHLDIQRWVNSYPSDSEMLLSAVRAAAVNARPMVEAVIRDGLPTGVHISFGVTVSQEASLHVVLELILGCLDPLLVNSPTGDGLRERLKDISGHLGLPPQRLTPRQIPETHLRAIFAHVLS